MSKAITQLIGLQKKEKEDNCKLIETMLQKDPDDYEMRVHPISKNPYMPISFIEKKLTLIFGGRRNWWTKNFSPLHLADEMCGSIELWVRWPDGWEQCNIGAAATTIQYDKQQAGQPKIKATDIHLKKRDAMVKGFPSLLSNCISNAAERLGPAFGTNLKRNKDQVETYSQIEAHELMDNLQLSAETVESITQWNAYLRDLPVQMINNPLVVSLDQSVKKRLDIKQLSESTEEVQK